ncbi:sigma-54-dependent Fis family transcriptional regulator [bacterium]|nr:sigma-54-dependent Fis family transcriptional regulator [bacterium]
MARLLIVDDEPGVRESLTTGLCEAGHHVHAVGTAALALEAANAKERWDVVLLDLGLPDRDGLEVLGELRARVHDAPVIVISGNSEMASTVRAMRDGAFDFMSKPLDPDELDKRIDRALRVSSNRAQAAVPPAPRAEHDASCMELVGSSAAMREVFKLLGLLAASRATVLIRGDSGTGKELAAKILHEFALGSAASAPFVAVNCAALPGPLVEAEIFGYKRGAFTGAEKDRPGKLEAAGDGTIFLDEVGEVPLETQVKLLRVLQERRYERLGETESHEFKARIVAATHRDLEGLVKSGKFREDLYYRLNVATVTLPPLRERRSDVPLIIERLLGAISGEVGRPVTGISPGALATLCSHDWPGNVRELRNVLTRAAVRCRGTVLLEEDIELASSTEYRLPEPTAQKAEPERLPTLEQAERDLVRRALALTRGHRAKTCALLGISRPTLLRKIKRYGLSTPSREGEGPALS